MNKIGPTFSAELSAAGVSLDGIAWGEDGAFCFREDVTQDTRDAVEAVLAAHDPAKMAPPPPLTDGELAGLLIRKGYLTAGDISAANGEVLPD